MASVGETNGIDSSRRLGGTATRGTVLLSASQACMLLSNGAINIVAARILLKADYGRFAVAMLVLAWTNGIVLSLIMPGLRKIVSEDHSRFPAALSFAGKWHTFATIVAGVGLLCLARPIARAFGDASLAPLFMIGAAQVPLMGAARLGMSLLTGLRRFGASSLVRVCYACSAAAACTSLIAAFGAAGGVGGAVTAALIAGSVSVALLLRERRHATFVAYPPMSRRVVHWACFAFPGELGLGTLMMIGMWLVKGLIEDPGAAGVYGVAYFVSRTPLFVVYGMSAAVFARVSNSLAEQKLEHARHVATEAMRVLMLVFILVCAAVAVSSAEIITFLFSLKHAGASESLVILAPAVFFAGQICVSLRLLDAAHRPGVRLAVTCFLVAAAVVCNMMLIPRFGIFGAALSSFIVFGAGAVIGAILVHHFLRALPPIWTAARCTAAGVAVFAVGWFWPAPGWLVLIKLTALSLLYAAVLFVLRELRAKDIKKVIDRVRT